MRISEVVGITGASLLNHPSISGINKICFSLEKLHRGDLFVTKNFKDIKQAVKKGAFGILFEGDFEPIDEEIAWLKIDSLSSACIAFVRYLFVDSGLKAIALDSITLEIAQSILEPQKALFATHDIFAFLEQISPLFDPTHQIETPPYIFTTQKFLDMINIDPCEVLCLKEPQLELNGASLIQMKVTFENQYYTLPIPALFFNHLYELIKIAQSLHISCNLEQILPIKKYQIHYFNSEGYLSNNQESNKVLITIDDMPTFKAFISCLEKNSKWAKKYYFLPNTEKISTKNKVFYENTQDAAKKLKQKSYHFALLYANIHDQEQIITALTQKSSNMNLFEYHQSCCLKDKE